MYRNCFRSRGINSEKIVLFDTVGELSSALRRRGWKEEKYPASTVFSDNGRSTVITVFNDGYVSMEEHSGNKTTASGSTDIKNCLMIAGTLIVGASAEV